MATAHGLIEFTVGTQNIVNNYTPVTAKFYAVLDSGYVYSGYTTYPKLTLDGTTETKSLASYDLSSSNPKVLLGSITKNVYHGSDGKKTVSASFTWDPDNSYLSTVTGSASKVLTTIPRATTPTFSATSVALNGSVTITLNPADSSFKHKIRYDFGYLTGQSSGISIGSGFSGQGKQSVTFKVPESLGFEIPAANSGTCKILCYTYTSSGTHIGTTTKNITITVPSYTPTISGITLTGNNLLSGAYVQGKSSVTADAEFDSSYYAYITDVVATVDGKNYTEIPFTSSVLSSGSKKVKFTVTDSRGKTASLESSAFTVYAYSIPQITTFTLERQTDGTTVIATVTGSIAAINNKNAKTITVNLNGKTNTITSTAYTISGTTTFTGVPTDSTLTATATFKDSYTSITKNATLPTVAVTMDFYKDGNGIAMGKVAEKPNLLDVAWSVKASGFKSQRGPRPTSADIAPEEKYWGSMEYFLASSAMTTGKPSLVDGYESSPDGHILHFHWDNNLGYDSQLYLRNKNGSLLTRGCNNGTWSEWKQFIDNSMCPDYVIEQGTTDGWDYTKWKNGKIELFGEKSLSFPEGTKQTDYLYRSIVSLNLSGLLTKIMSGTCSVQTNGMVPQVCRHSTNLATAEIVIVTSRTFSAFTITAPIYIIGKWK